MSFIYSQVENAEAYRIARKRSLHSLYKTIVYIWNTSKYENTACSLCCVSDSLSPWLGTSRIPLLLQTASVLLISSITLTKRMGPDILPSSFILLNIKVFSGFHGWFLPCPPSQRRPDSVDHPEDAAAEWRGPSPSLLILTLSSPCQFQSVITTYPPDLDMIDARILHSKESMCQTPAFPVSPETPYGKKEVEVTLHDFSHPKEASDSSPCCALFSSKNTPTLPSVQPARAPAQQPSHSAQRRPW